MKHLLLTVALIATQLVAMAESRITGVVKSTADEAAVEYATVRLFSTDSIFISGVQTDENGRFDLKGINDGSYRLDIACVGFQSQNIAIDNLDRNVDLGTIHLSPVSQELDEVTVTASPVVRKIDRQIILPTKEQRKAATNGISLIQSLQLSRISVSSIDNTIKVDGNSAVQLRINGAEASREEVMAIRPNEVVRIEYHDNPGLRYGNAAAVLDYIVKKRDDGGNVAADLANGVTHLGWGDTL